MPAASRPGRVAEVIGRRFGAFDCSYAAEIEADSADARAAWAAAMCRTPCRTS